MVTISHTYLFIQRKWSFKKTHSEWDSFTELFLSNFMKYDKHYIEWQTSIQGRSLSDFWEYLRKREGSFKNTTLWEENFQHQVYGRALHQMACIYEMFAQKFDVIFKSKKSQVILYKAYNVKPPDPCVTINDARVKCVDKVIHCGYLLTENVYEFNVHIY